MSIKFLAMCIALIGAFFSVFSAELNEVKNWKPIGAIYCNAPLFSRAALRRSSQKMQISFFKSSLYRPLFFYAADA